MQENNKIWPPEPSRPSGVPGPVINPKLPPGLLTNHPVWDFLVGLVAGPVVHVLLLMCSVVIVGYAHAQRYEYAPWGLAVLGGILLFVFLFRRYPYLMAGFIIATISVAMFSFIVVSIAPA